MKMRTGAPLLALAALVGLGACSDTFVPDFDNPSEADYAVIRTRDQLQSRAIGLLDNDRQTHDFQILLDETLGRNVYRLDGAESRYISVPLGPTPMGNTNFVGVSIYTIPYRTIRDGTMLINAVTASENAVPTPLTAEEKSATVGWAKTFQALQYMRIIEQRDTAGAPIVSGTTDANGLAPFHCKKDVLVEASRLLKEGRAALAAGGEAFPFEIPGTGFAGFDTPETFVTFNWALAARNYVYLAFQGGRAAPAATYLDSAQLALDNSFYDPAASLDYGVYHSYSSASGDYANPNFDQSVYRINPRVVYESEGVTVTTDGAGDTIAVSAPDLRVQRKVELDPTDNCRAVSRASSCFLDLVNASPSTPIPIIRNDELHLLQAEVYWGRNTAGTDAQALAIANDVRNRGGGFTTPKAVATRDDILREILKQKRYQLLFQSPSRWIDARMFGFLDELGLERGLGAKTDPDPGSDDFQGFGPVPNFRTPVAEVFARNVTTPEQITKVCNP